MDFADFETLQVEGERSSSSVAVNGHSFFPSLSSHERLVAAANEV
jgi:hypothetical protein